MKKFLTIIGISVFILAIIIIIFIFINIKFDYCMEDGLCKEGYELGNDIVNKEYCLKSNYKWIEEQKLCIML